MNKNSLTIITTCTVLFAGATVAAKAATIGNITGSVRDADGKPIAGVQVMIMDSREVVKTDKNGKFIFVGEDPQAYTLQVRAAGYKAASKSAVVKLDTTSAVTFTLTPLFLRGRVIRVPKNSQPDGTHPIVPDALPYSPDAFVAFFGDAGLHSTARSR